MKSRFISDLQDPSNSDFGTSGGEIFATFAPWVSYDDGNHLAHVPLEIVPPAPSFSSQTVASSGGQNAPNSAVAETSGGITFNLLFDAAAMAAPANFRTGIEQAASMLSASISDKITVNINIDYSGTGGGAAAGPDAGLFENYSSIRADLINNATPGDAIFNALPGGASIQGQSNIAVWNAQLKLFGLLGANDTTTDDGTAKFSTDINPNLLVGVALHELTHALGRIPYGPIPGSQAEGPQPDIFDLFRFTSPGTRLIAGAATAPAAYFSVDGGNTKLADFGQTSDSSDLLNSGVQGPNDPFNEFYSGSTLQSLTAVDKELLDALGFHTTAPVTTTVIESFGATSLVEVGTNYFLNSNSGGSGPELKYGGAAVTAGEFGTWTPIGGEQTASGYEVAWKNAATGQYTAWNTDSSGNYVSSPFGAVSGNDIALESIETIFHQDLNGDGVIGVNLPTIVIESFGATSLVEVGTNYFLNSNSGGSGPELKYGGAAVTAGEFGTWTPIGGEQTASGYEVAWKNAATGQYTAWNTDSSGNYVSSLFGAVSGTDTALESLETTFHQDLNGDGTIGAPTVVIQTDGSTALTEVGNNFFLYTSGTGPELKYGGAAVTAGEFGAWTLIGGEQTASGYEVAWKNAATGQYTAWNTDSSGNYVSSLFGAVSGTDTALESLETTFHQDLNGDGTIGAPTVVIQTDGSTALTEVGNNFFLYTSGTGPELKYGGAAVTAGEFGAWTPIGAIQTANGYDVAWKMAGADQYTVWNTDSSGNYVSSAFGAVSGSSTALESIETTFHQDLNGDGTIGIPPSHTSPTLELAGASSESVTFTGSPSILVLDTPSTFSGQISGFAGEGTLAGSDQIDLRGMNIGTFHSSYDASTGTLEVSDGTTTADLKFAGSYSQVNFKFAGDGSGGTVVYDAPTSGRPTPPNGAAGAADQIAGTGAVNLSVTTGHDTFVFAPNFGQVTLAHFNPTTDTIQISQSVFANIAALVAATLDNPQGNAVISDAAHDTITIQHVATTQLLAHQSDFHFL